MRDDLIDLDDGTWGCAMDAGRIHSRRQAELVRISERMLPGDKLHADVLAAIREQEELAHQWAQTGFARYIESDDYEGPYFDDRVMEG
jgi:hypothetical protein